MAVEVPGTAWDEDRAVKRTLPTGLLTIHENPSVKPGEMKDLGHAFEAVIVTKDNSLVDKIPVDENTGWIRSAY